MSKVAHPSSANRDIELGTELNWPPILAALGLGGSVLIAFLVMFLLSRPSANPRDDQGLALQSIAPVAETPVARKKPPVPASKC